MPAMNLGKRVYWVLALVAFLALAGAAVTATSQFAFAGGGTGDSSATQECDQQDEADDAQTQADTDNIEAQCGDQNDEDGAARVEDNEAQVPSGTLDDGKELQSQASVTLDEAISSAQAKASGPLGEIDLEYWHGKLVYNVDIGDKDVKVDAITGDALAWDLQD